MPQSAATRRAWERSRSPLAPSFKRDVRPTLGQCADHDHRRRLTPKDRIERFQAVHDRHLHVESDHVGPKGFNHFQPFAAVGRLAGDFHPRRGGDAIANDLPNERGIVHHEHANRRCGHKQT